MYNQLEPSPCCAPGTTHLSSGDWDNVKPYSQYYPHMNGQLVESIPAVPNNMALYQNMPHFKDNTTRRACSPVSPNNVGDTIQSTVGVSRFYHDEHTLYAPQQVLQDVKTHLHQPYITDPNCAQPPKIFYQPQQGGHHYNENFRLDNNISHFPAVVKPSCNRFQEPVNQKPHMSPHPPRSFCAENFQADQKSVTPVHDHGPLVSKCAFNSDVGASKTLWAVTRINIFPDDSRTYEVMKVTDDQPCTIPNSTDSVFVFVSSNNN